MCGLCGIVYQDRRPVPPDRVDAMARTLHHRGPDSAGTYVAAGVGLGFRRLAVVDLERGDQPIASEDGRTVLVCNGEIYNAPELRRDLEAAGHRFRSRSDAEVIVHLYEDRGTELLHALRGMFAFALWDDRRRRLLLARDRLGIKPLHWAELDGGLVFGSEIKALLAAGADVDLDPTSLTQLLTFRLVPSPRTLFRGVHRLPAGHFMVYEDGEADVRPYWRIEFPEPAAVPHRSAAEWRDAFRHHLEEAVRLHLRSDVPVGTWLSPGIDSSTVAALVRRISGERIPAFTLAFDDPAYDERAGHTTLADYPDSGVDGTDVRCTVDDFGRYPHALWHTETPTTAGAEVPRLIMSEAAARSVKVVVTGEGADELLGGYRWYRGERMLGPMAALPGSVRRWIASRPPFRDRWPGGSRVLEGPGALDLERYLRLRNCPDPDDVQALLAPPYRPRQGDGAGAGNGFALPEGARHWRRFQRLQYFDLGLRLPDAILHRVDRASMACSLEVRVPFLDHRLVEFCAGIPPSLKLGWRREKEILRRAMADLLPPEIVRRSKRGLRAPVDAWLREPLPEFARELLSPEAVRAKGYFRADVVQRLMTGEASPGHRRPGTRLAILAVQLWDEIFRCGWRPPDHTP